MSHKVPSPPLQDGPSVFPVRRRSRDEHLLRHASAYSHPKSPSSTSLITGLRVSEFLTDCGFNTDSLVVCHIEIWYLSCMCIAISGLDCVVEQARRLLEDFVPVQASLDITELRTISRKLLLVKVSVPRAEYLEDTLAGGPRTARTK